MGEKRIAMPLPVKWNQETEYYMKIEVRG